MNFDDERAYEELDDHFAFVVTCGECGAEFDNRDGDCSCGASSIIYNGYDAARWNDHQRRMGAL